MSASIILALRILIVFALYAFLALVFFSTWKLLDQNHAAVSNRRSTVITILLRSPSNEEKTLHFSRPDLHLGRDPANEIVVSDTAASNQHARLWFHHGQWWVEDRNSKNGTYLNETKVTSPTVVVIYDKITIGNSMIQIMPGDDPSTTIE